MYMSLTHDMKKRNKTSQSQTQIIWTYCYHLRSLNSQNQEWRHQGRKARTGDEAAVDLVAVGTEDGRTIVTSLQTLKSQGDCVTPQGLTTEHCIVDTPGH